MTEEILQINENLVIDESIEKYEFHEYTPVSGTTNLNKGGGEIRIVIETQDLFTHPSESYLIIEGRLTKTDDSLFTDADKITFCNNGLMHMFQYIKYELSGQEIENVNYVGQTTTMLGILKYSNEKKKGKNMMWIIDEDNGDTKQKGFEVRHNILIKKPDPKGTFSFRVPLKHIFGFAEDYDKIVYGFKHQLTLCRKTNDDDAIFKAADVADGKIILDTLSWFVPHVEPAIEQKLKLYKIIENKMSVDVGYRAIQCDSIVVPEATKFSWRLAVRSEKPRWIVVAFQTNRQSDQDKNASIFDHVDCRNIYVTLNSRRYPEADYKLSFPKQQFSRVFGDVVEFKSKFYHWGAYEVSLDPIEYKDLYPLFVFDVSKQSEKIKNSTIDIMVNAVFGKNVPAGTEAYAVVISDRILKFQSDGNKMSVVVG